MQAAKGRQYRRRQDLRHGCMEDGRVSEHSEYPFYHEQQRRV